MEPKLVGVAIFTAGAGTVTPTRMYNTTIARTADGDYNVTIGQGGVDGTHCLAQIYTGTGAAGGVGTARIVTMTHTSDTVKRIQVRDDVGALVLPAAGEGVSIALYKLPPLPTP